MHPSITDVIWVCDKRGAEEGKGATTGEFGGVRTLPTFKATLPTSGFLIIFWGAQSADSGFQTSRIKFSKTISERGGGGKGMTMVCNMLDFHNF